MAFVLIAVGVVLFVTAYQGTTGQLGSMLVQDVIGTQGNKGYLYWAVAILVVGAVGYIQKLKGLSDAFIGLLLLVIFISNQGFFAKFNQALGAIGSKASTAQTATNTSGGFLSPGSNPLLNAQSNPLLTSPGMSVPFNMFGGSQDTGWVATPSLGGSSDTGWYSAPSGGGSTAGGWTDTTNADSGWVTT